MTADVGPASTSALTKLISYELLILLGLMDTAESGSSEFPRI